MLRIIGNVNDNVIVNVNVHVSGGRQMAVTMADVARRAGVSTQTVSAVINGKSGISSSTIDRVRQIIAELDYHPNALAGSLRNRRTALIGLMVGDISDPFFGEAARAVEEVARQRGYVVLLCNTDRDPAKEEAQLQVLRRHQVAGVIGGSIEGVPSIKPRVPREMDRRGGYVATAHLLDLGHRRVGFIVEGLPPSPRPAADRLAGYREALADWSLPMDESLIVAGGPGYAGGQRAARQLLEQGNIPTAIFAWTDYQAAGAMAALDQEGLHVPNDVAVIGYGGTQLSASCVPQLSTVAMPIFEINALAMARLADQIEGVKRAAEPPPLEHELVVRRSTVLGLRQERKSKLSASAAPWAAWREELPVAEGSGVVTANDDRFPA
jgi:DNA-binding LacI/PurR family transcriptional regulator